MYDGVLGKGWAVRVPVEEKASRVGRVATEVHVSTGGGPARD